MTKCIYDRSEVFLFVMGKRKELQTICPVAIKNTGELVGKNRERGI